MAPHGSGAPGTVHRHPPAVKTYSSRNPVLGAKCARNFHPAVAGMLGSARAEGDEALSGLSGDSGGRVTSGTQDRHYPHVVVGGISGC
jgi:hypothetical protein